MFEHTSGPWRKHTYTTASGKEQTIITQDTVPYGWNICRMDIAGRLPSRLEADAALVAAAPELLAALEFVMEHNQPNTSYDTPLDYIALSHNDVQVIRAAIAAATAQGGA